jgi:hypothetical protein
MFDNIKSEAKLRIYTQIAMDWRSFISSIYQLCLTQKKQTAKNKQSNLNS